MVEVTKVKTGERVVFENVMENEFKLNDLIVSTQYAVDVTLYSHLGTVTKNKEPTMIFTGWFFNFFDL